MANELNISYTAGQAMEAAVYADGWIQQGTNVTLTEVASGLYSGDMPAAAAGCYAVLFINTTPTPDVVVGRGEIYWDGTAEFCLADIYTRVDELHKLQGLDSGNPMTVTTTSRVAGSITQAITGDGLATSTVTRT